MSNPLDALNRPIQVGDIVVNIGCGARYGVHFAKVIKLNPKVLQTNNGPVYASKCIVLNEQVRSNIETHRVIVDDRKVSQWVMDS